jgi:transporter family-2 protein
VKTHRQGFSALRGKQPTVSRTVAIVLSLVVGGVVGLQAPANAEMSRHIGDYGAALVSSLIAIILLAALFALFGDAGRLGGLRHFQPAWAIGGIGTATIVAVGIVAVRPLGAGALIALLVASQLVSSLVADRFGWFGLHHVGLTAGRIAGLLLVAGGTVLVTRG